MFLWQFDYSNLYLYATYKNKKTKTNFVGLDQRPSHRDTTSLTLDNHPYFPMTSNEAAVLGGLLSLLLLLLLLPRARPLVWSHQWLWR